MVLFLEELYFRKGLQTNIWKELNRRRTPEVFELSVKECLLIEQDMKAEQARSQVERNNEKVYLVEAEEEASTSPSKRQRTMQSTISLPPTMPVWDLPPR